jgi:hydroxypyruvate isomerase
VAYLGLKNQVEFVFEPLNTIKDHPGYSVNSTEKAIQILEGVDSPCMKLLFDAYHMSMMGEDIYQTTKKYNHWIGHIHLANPPHRSGPESEGDIDFVQFFKHLKNIDYQGTIGWEFFPEKSSQDAALAIKKIMEEQCQWINWNHLKK